MGEESKVDSSLDVFSRFHAVVLHHWVGSGYRVIWSPDNKTWLRSRDYEHPSSPWLNSPGEMRGKPDGPSDEDRAAAATLALEFTRREMPLCQRCWQRHPGLHFIAPNIYGDPEIYCVQMPSYTVVDSRGGSGRKKHWGSPFSCQSVEYDVDSGNEPRQYIGPLAVYFFGKPLPAEEVIAREWCSRCEGAAYNVRANSKSSGESEVDWARDRVERKVRYIARVLDEYYGNP
jgi:hypothetical protein